MVGIGETVAERLDSILAIRRVAREYGSVQECIVQNFRAKDDTAMRSTPDLGEEEYLATIAVTRLLLGPSVTCDNYTTSSEFLPQLRGQLADKHAVREDAEARGWDSEVARHARVITSLQHHLDRLQREPDPAAQA